MRERAEKRSEKRSEKRIRRTARCLAVMLMLILLLTGCAGGNSEERTETTVFQFGGKNITLGEVYLYALTISQDYERAYGTDVWHMPVTQENGKVTDMEAVTRKDIIEDIVKVKVLLNKAEQYGVTLGKDDRDRIESETETFWKNLTDEQIQQMELTRDMVKHCIEENVTAKKVYNAIMNEAGIEISDEEARMTTIYDMYFPCFNESENGTLSAMTAEQKKSQYDKAVQAYNTLISPVDEGAEKNVEALAAYYGLQNAEYVTKSPEEMKETYGEAITEMLYKLEDGSYSLVTETEYGYHIFYMKSLTDRQATDQKKARIRKEREYRFFSAKYAGWLKEADSGYKYENAVDFEVYGKIEF